jgi:hypothetical protein
MVLLLMQPELSIDSINLSIQSLTRQFALLWLRGARGTIHRRCLPRQYPPQEADVISMQAETYFDRLLGSTIGDGGAEVVAAAAGTMPCLEALM